MWPKGLGLQTLTLVSPRSLDPGKFGSPHTHFADGEKQGRGLPRSKPSRLVSGSPQTENPGSRCKPARAPRPGVRPVSPKHACATSGP